uniref:Denticleless E3 ubiquitin protein ligase homolog (Drosophila) n=1 Tax=Neogobius melanostomus TaxID=47308 RepID=A0A8C6WRJ1_9GOBI
MVFRSVVDGQLGKRRQNGRPAQPFPLYPLSFLLRDYSCVRRDEHLSYGNTGDTVPPFGLAFSSAAHLKDVLAVANEEGIVRVYNTESRDDALLKEWLAHENAVFDIAWVPEEPQLVTAAGDQMARLWDVRSGELLGCFRGHLCSLKSVAFAPQDKAVFCTGARDGNIMVWDMRCTKKDGYYKQVKQISGAHNKAEANSLFKTKKKRSSTRGMAPSVDTQQSVTVVLFRDQHTLISSGAVDGVVKMWDLRKSYSTHRQDPVALQTFPYPGSSLRTRLGYSGLVLDSTRANVMCNCTDDNIYMFNVSGVKTSPVAVFSGHQNSSFYIRSSLSPDDQFLASGSSDSHAYIWKLSSPSDPPMMLQGHSEEVTSVSWCPTDFTKIASCSDDHTVRLWRLRRGTEEVQSRLGEANLVGWARPKSPTKLLAREETTPAKTAGVQSFSGLSSPRPAACASNSASLPLPSSTNSPVPSPAARPKTPPPSSSGCPRPRLCQYFNVQTFKSSNPAAPPSEQRAKRRLEASGRSCCADAEGCQCVVELNPAKKSRLMSGLCCPDSDASAGAEKENSCPTAGNWLSVLGQKMKKSPKRTEGRLPGSPTTCSPQRMKKISTYFTKGTAE